MSKSKKEIEAIINVLKKVETKLMKEGLSYTDFDTDRTMKEFWGLMEAERVVKRIRYDFQKELSRHN
tara:strand:+ start:2527 stop:2727 length:201 start_codon:yes stop_codon:yes gene_type:complete